ncbi:MAG: tetratricopeptide repeat protein [Bacteroidaceae bacterium]|nr:tetratricopeptide repeat protein [Bacteroidaceae bacterium]
MTNDYFQSEEFKEILASYEKRGDKDRSIYLDADDFADIADYYLTNNKPMKAMKAIDMGLQIHPDEEVLLIVRSAAYIFQRQFDKAREILKTLDAEENSDVKYQVAQLEYAQKGRITKAEKIWREWLAMVEDEFLSDERRRENYIHIISSLVELRDETKEDLSKEKECAHRWIREYIDKFQPLGKYDEDLQLVDLCRDNDQADVMCDVLTQVLEEHPYLNKGWSTLALSQFLMQRYDQALESCDFALAINPNDMEAILTKAHTYYAMDAKDLAGPFFKEYLDKGGESIQAIPYAETLFVVGDSKSAVKELQWLANLFERDRKKALKRWMSAQIKQLDEESLEHERDVYEDFIDLYKRIHIDISDLYHHKGCIEQSIDINKRILKVDPKCPEAFFMLGIDYLTIRNYEESAHYLALALQTAHDQIMMGLDIALTFILNDFDQFGLDVLNAITNIANNTHSPYVKNIPAAKSLTYLKLGNAEMFLDNFKEACHETPDLIKKVYGIYFPDNMPVSQWGDYAEREFDVLLRKFKKEDFFKGGTGFL